MYATCITLKGQAMVTVIVLEGTGVTQRQVGHIEFAAIPIQPGHYQCYPADLLSVDEVDTIADELLADHVLGKVGIYEWRRL